MTEPEALPERPGLRLLGFLLGLGVIALLVFYLLRSRGYIAENYTLEPLPLAGIAVLTVVVIALRGIANWLLFRELDVDAPLPVWLQVMMATTFVNYLPLPAGVVARGVFLKRVHNLPYRVYALGQLTLFMTFLGVNGLVGLAALTLWLRRSDVWIVGVAFAAMTLGLGVVMLPRGVLARAGRAFSLLGDSRITLRRSTLFAIGLCQLGSLLAVGWKLQLAFGLGPIEASLAACLVFSAIGITTRMVSVTPGGIGVREFLIGGVAYAIGFQLENAVIASALERAVELAVVMPLGALSVWTLGRRMASTYRS